MNRADDTSDDECVCGTDAAALGYCRIHYSTVTLEEFLKQEGVTLEELEAEIESEVEKNESDSEVEKKDSDTVEQKK